MAKTKHEAAATTPSPTHDDAGSGARSEVAERDALLDKVYWFRQIVSLLCGIIFGLIPLTSTSGFIGFGIVGVLGPAQFAKMVLGIDKTKIEMSTVLSEGLQSATFVFLASWVFTFSWIVGLDE